MFIHTLFRALIMKAAASNGTISTAATGAGTNMAVTDTTGTDTTREPHTCRSPMGFKETPGNARESRRFPHCITKHRFDAGSKKAICDLYVLNGTTK